MNVAGRRGFTLVEIIAVLVIMAIAAAAVTLNVRAPLAQAATHDLVDQLVLFDRLTRVQARSGNCPVRLAFDLGQGQIRRTTADGSATLGVPLELPDGYTLDRVCVAGQEAASGSVVIPCSRLGLTPSYAICLAGPAKSRQWLVVAGLTGEVVQPVTESEAHELLAAGNSGAATK